MGLGRLAVLSTLGAIVLPAGEALAGTVSANAGDVTFSAGPGETNAVLFTYETDDRIRISDSGAPLTTSSPDCAPVGADVICEFFSAGWADVNVELNDGEDSLDVPQRNWANVNGGPGNDDIVAAGSVYGGPGNDRIETSSPDGTFFFSADGGEGDDLILGGEWTDDIWGGPGNDTIRGGGGPDQLVGAGGDDVVIGGLGFDTSFARGRNLQLTPTALIGQGNDTLSSIQDVLLEGSNGTNVINARTFNGSTYIIGFGGDDVIVGGLGRDRIRAGAGNDRLAGGLGRDTLWGEAGADLLLSRDGLRDGVFGGQGQDRARVDRIDRSVNIEVVLP